MMRWTVVEVEAQDYLTLKVTFHDGLEGLVILKPSRLRGVFEPLKSHDYFNQVYVNYGAVAWPGDIDLAPDAMYEEIKKNGTWVLS